MLLAIGVGDGVVDATTHCHEAAVGKLHYAGVYACYGGAGAALNKLRQRRSVPRVAPSVAAVVAEVN